MIKNSKQKFCNSKSSGPPFRSLDKETIAKKRTKKRQGKKE